MDVEGGDPAEGSDIDTSNAPFVDSMAMETDGAGQESSKSDVEYGAPLAPFAGGHEGGGLVAQPPASDRGVDEEGVVQGSGEGSMDRMVAGEAGGLDEHLTEG
jgi:hypothetical protein